MGNKSAVALKHLMQTMRTADTIAKIAFLNSGREYDLKDIFQKWNKNCVLIGASISTKTPITSSQLQALDQIADIDKLLTEKDKKYIHSQTYNSSKADREIAEYQESLNLMKEAVSLLKLALREDHLLVA